MKFRFPLYAQVIVAMALGVWCGQWLGPSTTLGELGKLVIQLIKVVASPLLFLVIVKGVLTSEVQVKSGFKLVGWALVNATLALAIGLAVANVLDPGKHFSALLTPTGSTAVVPTVKSVEPMDLLRSVVPTSVMAPWVDNNMLGLVAMALLTGLSLRKVRHEHASGVAQVVELLSTALRATEVVLNWALRLIPFAVFGVVVKAVAEHGFSPLRGLVAYVFAGLLGLALHIALTYQTLLVLVARRSLRQFWRHAKEPVIYALGTNSSLATLPVTLKALDALGVSKAASTLGACVGTNFNNDGIILYEGMAVLFVAQASGIDLSLSQQALVAGISLVAAMGVAGVPEAGFISLALVLHTVGLPVELLPLLLTVDWIIARARSATNVLSDMMLSILIDGPLRHPR